MQKVGQKVPLSYAVKISFQFYLLFHLCLNNYYETPRASLNSGRWQTDKSVGAASEALSPGSESKAAHHILLWAFGCLKFLLSLSSKSSLRSQWEIPAQSCLGPPLGHPMKCSQVRNPFFIASSPFLLFVSPSAVECRDTTRYCEKVKQLKLCQLTQFKSRCCGTCGKAWRQKQWKRRNKGITAFASLRQGLLQKIQMEWNSFFHFIYLFPFKKKKRKPFTKSLL